MNRQTQLEMAIEKDENYIDTGYAETSHYMRRLTAVLEATYKGRWILSRQGQSYIISYDVSLPIPFEVVKFTEGKSTHFSPLCTKYSKALTNFSNVVGTLVTMESKFKLISILGAKEYCEVILNEVYESDEQVCSNLIKGAQNVSR